MKTKFLLLILISMSSFRCWSGCLSCGGSNGGGAGSQAGPSFFVSLGTIGYGLPAGEITYSAGVPSPDIYAPNCLVFNGSETEVALVFTNTTTTTYQTNLTTDALITTNIIYTTNVFSGTNIVVTNLDYSVSVVTLTNVETILTTNNPIRQVCAPQALADIPTPMNGNGFMINFYFPSQINGTNSSGLYLTNGTPPFRSWIVTNTDPSNLNHLRISETSPTDGILKQWDYTYMGSSNLWMMQTKAGIQKNMVVTNLTSDTYQVINSIQYSNGPVAQETRTTYQVFNWGVAPIRVETGPAASPQVTTYTYYDPSTFVTGNQTLKETVVHPDGSQEYYASYDAAGNPTDVYFSFGDNSTGREITYVYNPSTAGTSGSGDDGTYNPTAPRRVIEYVQGNEASRRYSIFPTADIRLDVQCTVAGAGWDGSGNLVTTNHYYASGPNQFALQSVIRPDGTMTVYEYATNATYRTNITVNGQPDSTYSHIVDGVSNHVVVNQWGSMVSSESWDVKSGFKLLQDVYGNYDSFGRPQRVAHLDGTVETNGYACCGLNYSTDRDGVNTVYLYDDDKRQVGYEKLYNTDIITYENALNAVGHVLKTFRIGTDSSVVTASQSAYDTAGRLIAQTNALNGVTTYVKTANSLGALVRTVTYPNSGTRIENYYLDGSLKSVTGTAVHPVRYEYGGGNDDNGNSCSYTKEIKLNNDSSDSAEWTKTFTDMAGRTTETLYSDGSYSRSFYNTQGQLTNSVDPDGVSTLYAYDAKGELAFTTLDFSRNHDVFGALNRITQTTNDVLFDSNYGATVRRSRNFVWLDGAPTGTPVFATETSTDGLDTWQTQYRDVGTPVTTHSHTVPGIVRTVKTTAPDNSYAISTNYYGRLVGSAKFDATGNVIVGTTNGYDAQGRLNTMTDARNGTTTLGFNDADLVTTNTTPNPGGGYPEITKTFYNNMLQATNVVQPDFGIVTNIYLLTGELGLQSGSRIYPVSYSYDYAGRMLTMTNWSNFGGGTGARATTWNYDGQRGWLTSKAYDDGNGPAYTYTAAGRLASRAWVRGITTGYVYDTGGSLTNVNYSDSTPSVATVYDRLGRASSVTQNGMTDTLAYNLANELLGESFSGGTLAGLAITNRYDACLRRTNLSALLSNTPFIQQSFGFDAAARLQTVNDGNNNSATYLYVANSPLVSQITFKQSSTTRMTTTKQYDYLNRLTQISSVGGASYASPISFNYTYNSANQRTHNTLADGSYWIYGYDSLGQATNACKYFADGTPVAGQQFDYTFDTIGNRTQTKAGGDATGANLRTANYSANNLNQITSRDVPPFVDVLGASIFTNAVTVNGNTAYRKEEYFRQQLAANNSASALWTNIIVAGGQSVTGNVYVAKQPETFSYDADGNLTNDGRFSWTWDGENRLIGMTVNTNVGPQYQLTFAYDAKGRRIQKIVATNGVALSTNNFLYDGWNLIAETRPDNSLIRSYVWGTDLSGTSQGAGGVGGLLEISYYGSSTTNCFPAYDGNGNIMALVNAADGTLAANYDYGAFGEPIRITGAMARNNPFRFSTKYADDESDLLYYGYRFYKPSTGSWLGRDPLNDIVFLKSAVSGLTPRKIQSYKDESLMPVYEFSRNNPIEYIDSRGDSVLLVGLGIGVLVVGAIDVIACRAHMQSIIQQATDTANDQMSNLVPNYDPEQNGPFHEGSSADALHHCIGACMANQNPGPCLSCPFVRNRIQNRENGPGLNHAQDRENNKVGFGITKDCVSSCVQALKDGKLNCFNAGDTSLSPCKLP